MVSLLECNLSVSIDTETPVTVLQSPGLRASLHWAWWAGRSRDWGQGWSPLIGCQVLGQEQGLLGTQVGGTCRGLLCAEQEKAREVGSEGGECPCPWQRGSCIQGISKNESVAFPDLEHCFFVPGHPMSSRVWDPGLHPCLSFPTGAEVGQFGPPSRLLRSAEPRRQASGRPPRHHGPAKAPAQQQNTKAPQLWPTNLLPKALPCLPLS